MTPATRLPSAIHRVMVAQALSKLGDNFTEVALAIFILHLTHNVASLGLVLAMAFLPRFLLGPVLIGVVDRLPKRAVLLASDGSRALLVVSLPFVHDYLYTVVIVFLLYALAMVYQPVLGGIQPQIAGDGAVLQRAMARRETYFGLGDITAYAVAGGLIVAAGTTPAFLINGATFLASGLLIATLRVPATVWTITAIRERFGVQVQQAMTFIREHRVVLFLVVLSGNIAVGSINTVLAPLSPDLWHVSTAHYAWLVLAIAVGLLVGGLVAERWAIAPVHGIALGLGLTGLGLVGTLVSPTWVVGLAPLAVSGFGNAFFGSSLAYLTQQSTPATVRTRVLTLRSTLMGAGGALGAYGSGWVAHGVSLPVAVLAVGALWVALALATVMTPTLRVPTLSAPSAS